MTDLLLVSLTDFFYCIFQFWTVVKLFPQLHFFLIFMVAGEKYFWNAKNVFLKLTIEFFFRQGRLLNFGEMLFKLPFQIIL